MYKFLLIYKLLLIAAGGALGTLARYGTGTLMLRAMERTGFPWGTLAVNVVGCFLIGYLNGLFAHRVLISTEYRQAMLIGFLGGYTTFSSFGWETMAFVRQSQYALAAVNFLANNVVGLAMVMVGYVFGNGRL